MEIIAINPVGAPPLYKPEYCQMLLEHMSQGKAIESFAFKIGVCRTTLYNWFDRYPEFLYTKKVGECGSFAWWEEEGQKGLWGDTIVETEGDTKTVTNSKMQSTLWIYNMKCRFKKFGWNISADDNNEESKQVTININAPE